jgi:hypothetical protein
VSTSHDRQARVLGKRTDGLDPGSYSGGEPGQQTQRGFGGPHPDQCVGDVEPEPVSTIGSVSRQDHASYRDAVETAKQSDLDRYIHHDQARAG